MQPTRGGGGGGGGSLLASPAVANASNLARTHDQRTNCGVSLGCRPPGARSLAGTSAPLANARSIAATAVRSVARRKRVIGALWVPLNNPAGLPTAAVWAAAGCAGPNNSEISAAIHSRGLHAPFLPCLQYPPCQPVSGERCAAMAGLGSAAEL